MEHPVPRTLSSPAWARSHLQPGHLSGCPEPPVHRQARMGVKGHAPSTTNTTRVKAGAAINNIAALAPRGQGPRHSGAMYATCVSLSIFEGPIISSSTTAKPILEYC
jgi:hypothetical protein